MKMFPRHSHNEERCNVETMQNLKVYHMKESMLCLLIGQRWSPSALARKDSFANGYFSNGIRNQRLTL